MVLLYKTQTDTIVQTDTCDIMLDLLNYLCNKRMVFTLQVEPIKYTYNIKLKRNKQFEQWVGIKWKTETCF